MAASRLRRPPGALLIAAFFLSSLLVPVDALGYTIAFTGGFQGNVTQRHLGVGAGHGHAGSNWLPWMQYLGPTSVRYFVATMQNWRKFITARGAGAWGRSFGGAAVGDQVSWEAAVAELRGSSKARAVGDLFAWIQEDESVRWGQFVRTLTQEPVPGRAATETVAGCGGAAADNLPALRDAGIKVLALWHVTCKNLLLSTTDRASPAYWAERWELYRWFYLGGRFFADNGVDDIEIYNEPDRSLCLTSATWQDELRVRSLALQEAYADFRERTGSGLTPTIVVPPMSAPRYDEGTHGLAFGRIAMMDLHTKFPTLETDPNWWNGREYSYHQYNSPGHGMRSAFDKVSAGLRAQAGPVPIRVTEHSVYASRTQDQDPKHIGKDSVDWPVTAAMLSGQIIALAGRTSYSSVNKFTQTTIPRPSGVVKNGLMWADLGRKAGGRGVCDVGGVSRSGEAYRLLLRHAPGGKPMLASTVTPKPKGYNFFQMAVSDGRGYYFYLSNAKKQAQWVTLGMARLAGIAAEAPAVVTAVSGNKHGEVIGLPAVPGATRALKLSMPPESTVLVTVPKGPTATALLPCVGAAGVAAGTNALRSMGKRAGSVLTVQTSSVSAASTAAAYFKFDLGGIPRDKIIAAVLTITQANTATSGGPQILTVLGTGAGWTEAGLTWATAPGLQPLAKGVAAIADNFVDFGAAKPVGHVTAGVAGQPTLALDVGDYLRAGGDASFSLVRMFRFDQRGSGVSTLAADRLGGPVTLLSRAATTGRPVLRVIYKQ